MNYADIAVYGKDKNLQLLVEVKSRHGRTINWAAQMRRNMYAHGLLPQTRFFLLALSDKFYLWKDVGILIEAIKPNYEINPLSFLESYYKKANVSPSSISEASLELIVSSWLTQIITVPSVDLLSQEYQDWLIESGLFHAIHGGHIESSVLV
ncbi:MAG: hypothetical protein AAF349_13470 [Cyanobacteria bacterium P01_A01_bin.68]